MKIDADDKELRESVERGEWKSAAVSTRNGRVASRSPKSMIKES